MYISWYFCRVQCRLHSSGSANWLGEVALVHGVLRCHSKAVGGPGFETSLYVKITMHSSHSRWLIGRLLSLLLFDHECVLCCIHHYRPLNINANSTYSSSEHFWYFKTSETQREKERSIRNQ